MKVRPLHYQVSFHPLVAFLVLLYYFNKVQNSPKKVLIEVLISCKGFLLSNTSTRDIIIAQAVDAVDTTFLRVFHYIVNFEGSVL